MQTLLTPRFSLHDRVVQRPSCRGACDTKCWLLVSIAALCWGGCEAALLHDRVVQQAATLAARVAGGADPLAPQQLVNLLRALTGCLSLLRQRVHDELLAQALGVSLWSCAQVRSCAQLQNCEIYFYFGNMKMEIWNLEPGNMTLETGT